MPPLDARNSRRGGRPRGRLDLGPIEALERREVLSYSALGVSLPDLTIKGYSGPVAAYGGSLTVTVDVFNLGASSLNEPLALDQLAPSSADSGPTSIDVYLTTRPGGGHVVPIGTLAVPSLSQNNAGLVTGALTLPARPKGFPAGGKVYLAFGINSAQTVLESDYTNNFAVSANPVTLSPNLPNLQVIGFDSPANLVPGETLQPSIRIANIGPAATNLQGPVTVEIVASQDKNFGPGDKVLATYTIANLPGQSNAPTAGLPVLGDANLQPGSNIGTLGGLTFRLPASPKTYFLGVKVDPFHQLKQLGNHSSAKFDVVEKVGPPIPGQSLATLVAPTTGGTVTPPIFPFPLGLGTGVPTPPIPTPTPPLLGPILLTTSPVVSPSSGAGVVVKNGVSLGAIGSAQALAIRGAFRAKTGIHAPISTPLVNQGATAVSSLDPSPQAGNAINSTSGRPVGRIGGLFTNSTTDGPIAFRRPV